MRSSATRSLRSASCSLSLSSLTSLSSAGDDEPKPAVDGGGEPEHEMGADDDGEVGGDEDKGELPSLTFDRRRRCFWKKERGVEVGLGGAGGGGGTGGGTVASAADDEDSSDDGDDDERCEVSCGDDATRVADVDDDREPGRNGAPVLSIDVSLSLSS